MSASSTAPTGARTPRRDRPVAGRRRRFVVAWSRLLPRLALSEGWIAGLLGAVAVAVTVSVVLFPTTTPFTILILPVVLGSILLGPRTLPWFVLFVMALLGVSLLNQEEVTSRTLGAAAVQLAVQLVVLVFGFRRARLGVAGLRGETMFVDLRDRILDQGGVPVLPDEWTLDSALHSAGGTAFSGDFVVSSHDVEAGTLDTVLVDVSGKGEDAGTRALLLSGAFGGLLGALAPCDFLPAANRYLLRQSWEEGFATAIHLRIDTTTGAFQVRSAGHPPAVVRVSGSGRWRALESHGPVLGLIDDAEFVGVEGVLAHGDTLLMFTDGMVEEPRRDIDLGIDKLLGQAETLLHGPLEGAAERLAAKLGSRSDDRAVVLLRRD